MSGNSLTCVCLYPPTAACAGLLDSECIQCCPTYQISCLVAVARLQQHPMACVAAIATFCKVSSAFSPAAAWYFPLYLYAQGAPGFLRSTSAKIETQKK